MTKLHENEKSLHLCSSVSIRGQTPSFEVKPSQTQSGLVKPSQAWSNLIKANHPWTSQIKSLSRITHHASRITSRPLQLDSFEHFHPAVRFAAEVVVEPAVFAVKLVVDRFMFAVRMIGRSAGADHVVGGFVHVGVDARSQRGVHRGAEGAGLFAGSDLDRTTGDVGVNLEQQR